MQILVDRLKAERALLLDLFVRQLKIFSKRALLPEERIALAELERELLTIRERWQTAGLLPTNIDGTGGGQKGVVSASNTGAKPGAGLAVPG
jgi:hypothetical protein